MYICIDIFICIYMYVNVCICRVRVEMFAVRGGVLFGSLSSETVLRYRGFIHEICMRVWDIGVRGYRKGRPQIGRLPYLNEF
jgi:hypothetical protein